MGTEFHDDWTSVPFLVSPVSHLLTFVIARPDPKTTPAAEAVLVMWVAMSTNVSVSSDL